jgi:AraC-like DNA-binding protein
MTELTNDLLSDALGLMHISASLLLAEACSPPWGVSLPGQAKLARILKVGRDVRVVAFHYVHRGSLELRGANGEQKQIQAGDVLVCFGGLEHRISQGAPSSVITFEAHLHGERSRIRSLGSAQAHSTALVCGVFLLSDTRLNPLFASLPPFMHARHSEIAGRGLSSTAAELLVHEVGQRAYGSDYAIQRLLELLCLDSIRMYMSTVDEPLHGWLRGIADPLMGQALRPFHRDPGRAWSVGKLAAAAHLSPSRFAARFAAEFGESSMAYVAKWRMNVARHLLRRTGQSVEAVALNAGYQNLPAFTRAFKRHIGLTPAAWRAAQL